MYDFVDTTGRPSQPFSPVDQMRVFGLGIGEVIQGFEQLSVTGRGLIEQEIEATEIPRRSGTFYSYKTPKERNLSLKFILSAETSQALREKLVQLNQLLAPRLLEISFDDEPDWTYYAVFSKADAIEETSLQIISQLEFICPDPYAYGKEQSSSGAIRLQYAEQVLPTKIEVRPYADTNQLRIQTNEHEIVLNGAYSQGQHITIDYLEDHVSVKKDETDITTDIALHKPPENFYIKNNDTVTCKGGALTIYWCDKRL